MISSLLAFACGADVGPNATAMGPVAGSTADGMGMPGDGPIAGTIGAPVAGPDKQPVIAAGAGGVPPDGVLPTTEPERMPASQCASGIPGTSQIPRLTNAQYDRTIRDLLGLDAVSGGAPSNMLATEQGGVLTGLAWSGYQGAADAIAREVMGNAELKSNFLKCVPAGDGAACLTETIREFGRRAYRRPLTDEEAADFENLVALGPEITASGDPEEVAEVVLAAFLMSPSFLQRAELAETTDADGNFTLSSYEVAARLSFMLWGSMPDATLSQAAEDGLLQTKEQVLAQAQRMVTDDRAREVAQEFHRNYLHLTYNSRWDTATKDATLFPQFEGAVGPLIQETEQLFDNVFASGGGFQDLLTTNVGYVNAKTAPLYGLDASQYGDELEEVQFADRPGFLTRAAFLSAFSQQGRTSPILRGTFITKEVLGINPGNPDPAATLAALPEGAGLDTNRKRVEEQTKNEPCRSCHQTFINPPGFVLEAFDTTGALQTTELATGAPIDTVADVRFSMTDDPETIADPAALMARLAASTEAQRYYASRWVGFAYERVLAAPDVCVVDDVSSKVTAGGYSIQSLLTDLTQNDSFLTRAFEVTQ